MVRESVDSGSLPLDHPILEERPEHVLLISSDSPVSENDPLILADSEGPSSVPLAQGGDHTIPPPSLLAISFDWSHLTAFRLPSQVPFQITVLARDKAVPGTVLDEGASVSLMSYTTW